MITLTAPVTAWAETLDAFAGMRGSGVLPILNCLLFQDGAIVRNDQERQITLTATPLKWEGDGSLAIDAKKLADLVRVLPRDADLTLRQNQSRATLTATRAGQNLGLYQVGILPGEDYPLLTTDHDQATHITVEGLTAALGQVAFAAGKNDVRYYINGIYCAWDDATLTLAATDGHSLGTITIPAVVTGTPGSAIIANDTAAQIAKLGGGPLTLEFAPTRLRIAQGRQLLSKLISGRFPDYRRVIPEPNDNAWLFNVADLTQAIKRIRILAGDLHGAIFDGGLDQVTISTRQDDDEAEEVVPLLEPCVVPVRIAFNTDYVLNVLAACHAETIRWEVTGSTNSSRLIPGTTSQHDPEWVLMPILI